MAARNNYLDHVVAQLARSQHSGGANVVLEVVPFVVMSVVSRFAPYRAYG
ncbi:hypothetical protein AB0L82_12045 [Nocardia sp. NPDC052001]